MNKKEVVGNISQATGLELKECIQIIDSLEVVLTRELEETNGVRTSFDKIFLLMDFLKNRQDNKTGNEAEMLVRKVALLSESAFGECQKVINMLIEILTKKLEVSKSARFKFNTAYALANLFKSNQSIRK